MSDICIKAPNGAIYRLKSMGSWAVKKACTDQKYLNSLLLLPTAELVAGEPFIITATGSWNAEMIRGPLPNQTVKFVAKQRITNLKAQPKPTGTAAPVNTPASSATLKQGWNTVKHVFHVQTHPISNASLLNSFVPDVSNPTSHVKVVTNQRDAYLKATPKAAPVETPATSATLTKGRSTVKLILPVQTHPTSNASLLNSFVPDVSNPTSHVKVDTNQRDTNLKATPKAAPVETPPTSATLTKGRSTVKHILPVETDPNPNASLLNTTAPDVSNPTSPEHQNNKSVAVVVLPVTTLWHSNKGA